MGYIQSRAALQLGLKTNLIWGQRNMEELWHSISPVGNKKKSLQHFTVLESISSSLQTAASTILTAKLQFAAAIMY